MWSRRCLSCGHTDLGEGNVCESCGQELLEREAYERRLKELRDYRDLRKRYGILSILVGMLILLVSCAFGQWLAGALFSAEESLPGSDLVRAYAAPAVVALVFFAAVFPLLLGRWRILRRYRWTKERMRSLRAEVETLPAEVLEPPTPAERSGQQVKGPPVVLLLLVFGLAALFIADQQFGLGVKEAVVSLFDSGSAVTVSGEYQRYYGQQDLGGGVARSEQTWSYVFYPDGTYTTFVNGYQQYGDRWSQSGSDLSITIPVIPGMTTAPRTFQAKVSRDGRSFTAGDETYRRVD